MQGYRLVHFLGRGGQCDVYEGVNNTHGVSRHVVKIHHHVTSCKTERDVLKILNDNQVGNVPEILEEVGENYNIMTHPKLETIRPVGKSEISGEEVCKIITVVEKAHKLGVIHRDIKPDNIFMKDGEIYLNDWSSAIQIAASSNAHYVGTPAYYAKDNNNSNYVPMPKHDNIAIVKTAYCSFFGVSPPSNYQAFWSRFDSGVWEELITHANNCDYETMRKTFINLKPKQIN